MPFSRTRILRRYQTVLRVLSRYGFGFLAEHLGLRRFVPRWPWPRSEGPGQPGRGERLRMALEELGPAFVKLGQMLSMRSDLLPTDIVTALERLQDQVAPFPFAEARALVEEELGGPLETFFAHVEPEPVAAASLGQVHEAVLLNGRQVVIKIQRPGVAEQVELDLEVLRGLATLATRRTHWGRSYDLPAVAAEFGAMLRAELDYMQEGRNAERFRANFAEEPQVRFPAVHWEQTTEKVLTLERVGGFRPTDRQALLKAGVDPAAVAQRLAGALFRMVLKDGFFHADPHPGNMFVTRTGSLIFVDMGMVGELTPAMRDNVIDYVVGVVSNDADKVVQAILRMGVIRRPANLPGLRREVERLQRKYGDIPLKQIELGPALRETLEMARRYEVSFPTGYAVLLKAMTTLEAVARQVDPDATLIGLASPYADVIMQGQLQPDRLLSRVGRELLEAGRHAARVPRQISRVLHLMEEGEWKVGLNHSGLESTLHRLSAIANRLAIAILLASLIIGTALVSSSGAADSFLQRYSIADVGFVLIGAVGLWLILSILGSGRS